MKLTVCLLAMVLCGCSQKPENSVAITNETRSAFVTNSDLRKSMADWHAEQERKQVAFEKKLAAQHTRSLIEQHRDEQVRQLDLYIAQTGLLEQTKTLSHSEAVQRIAKAEELKSAATNNAFLDLAKLSEEHPEVK